MVRYLSAAWFDRLRLGAESFSAPEVPTDALVLRHVVQEGEDLPRTDYDVVVSAGWSMIRHPVQGSADLVFTSDYPTAAAIAAGTMSTNAALAAGRLRVAGDVNRVSARAADMTGLDPVPASLRAETEY